MKTDAHPPLNQRHLDEVVEALANAGNNRGVICLVERWAASAQPSRIARLHLVRAFLNLLLMDRAWLRIRELLESDPDDLDAVALAAEMFILRGWPSRARRLLDEAVARHPNETRLRRFVEESRRPPQQPPSNARMIEQQGSPADLLALAERFLATGSFLRTRTLLEKIRRLEPGNIRAQDLMWGLQGDFGSGEVSAEELALELVPEIARPPDPENTDSHMGEEVTAARISEDSESPVESGEFPSLFRQIMAMPLTMADEDTGEITQPVQMASPDDLKKDSGEGTRDPLAPAPPSRIDDTEIMMVIQGAPVKTTMGATPVHKRKEGDEGYNLRETLNLREYRAHMGMEDPNGIPLEESTGNNESIKADFLEEEDEDRVVVTRRDPSSPSARTAEPPRDTPRAPLKIIEKHPVPAPEPEPAVDPILPVPSVEPEAPRAPAPDRVIPRRTAPNLEAEALLGPPPTRIRLRTWVVLGLLSLLAGLFLLTRWGACYRADSLKTSASRSINADNYEELLKAEAVLSERLKATSGPDPIVLASLARVETVLWDDYVNNQEHLRVARELVEKAQSEPLTPIGHLAAAELALSERRTAVAREHLDAYGTDDLDRWCAEARYFLLTDRPDNAIEALKKASSHDSKAVRPRRELVEVLVEQERLAEARAVLEELRAIDPSNARVEIAYERIRTREMPPMEIAANLNRLVSRLPGLQKQPRIESEIYRQGAEALFSMGEKDRAEVLDKQAFAKDGSNPDLLRIFALQALREHKRSEALTFLQEAIGYRPGDVDLQIAHVRVLVDMDRLEEALRVIESTALANPQAARLPVLKAWLYAVGLDESKSSRELLTPYLESHPKDAEARFLLGYALMRAGEPEATSQLDESMRLLEANRNPESQALLPRAMAARLLVPGRASPGLRERLEATHMSDSWVCLMLAWQYREGQDSRAVALYSRAAELGNGFGRAYFEKGNYALDAGDGKRQTRESWKKYLDLQPTGSRAERVQNLLKKMR